MQTSTPSRQRARALCALVAPLLMAGCLSQAEPAAYSEQTVAPPWAAPRDAVSHIRQAGLAELPLNDTSDPWILDLVVTVDGKPVPLAANIGVDRPRALQAPVHTHDDSGQVWLEGKGNRTVTLDQFFTLWGVRFDQSCLGAACGGVSVTADGAPVTTPASLVLRGHKRVTVAARS